MGLFEKQKRKNVDIQELIREAQLQVEAERQEEVERGRRWGEEMALRVMGRMAQNRFSLRQDGQGIRLEMRINPLYYSWVGDYKHEIRNALQRHGFQMDDAEGYLRWGALWTLLLFLVLSAPILLKVVTDDKMWMIYFIPVWIIGGILELLAMLYFAPMAAFNIRVLKQDEDGDQAQE